MGKIGANYIFFWSTCDTIVLMLPQNIYLFYLLTVCEICLLCDTLLLLKYCYNDCLCPDQWSLQEWLSIRIQNVLRLYRKLMYFLSELGRTLLISTVQCLHNNKLLQHMCEILLFYDNATICSDSTTKKILRYAHIFIKLFI